MRRLGWDPAAGPCKAFPWLPSIAARSMEKCLGNYEQKRYEEMILSERIQKKSGPKKA